MTPLLAAETEAGGLGLICAPALIFDTPAIDKALDDATRELSDPTQVRAAVVAVLGEAQKQGRARIAKRVAHRPHRNL